MKLWGFVKENKTFFLLLAIALLLRVFLIPFGTLETPDFTNFHSWGIHIAKTGPGEFYDTIWADYTPGYLYVLWVLGEIEAAFPLFKQKVFLLALYKLPAILADIAAGVLIFLAVSRFNKKFAIAASALYLFNPGVFGNSAMWGQIDGLIGLFVLAAVFFVSTRPLLVAFILALGTQIKPSVAFIAPFIGLLWLRTLGWWKAAIYTLITAALFVAGFLPFSAGKPFIPFIFERMDAMIGLYKHTSANAFNLWAIVTGFFKPDLGWPKITGIIITVGIIAIALWFWWKTEKNDPQKAYPYRFFVAALIMAGAFLFMTRMHERHLLQAFALLSVAAAAFPLLWSSYAMFSLTYALNLRFAYVWLTQDFRWIFPRSVVVLLSIINLIAIGIMGWTLFRPKTPEIAKKLFVKTKETFSKIELRESTWISKHWKTILLIILVFALMTRLYNIAAPNEFYFDEIYHSFTATEIAKGNPDAWVWWGDTPKDRAYSWDHPPIPKLAMAAGIALFGENPFGWRIPGVLFGVATIVFIYLIGVHLFKTKTAALLAAALFALDGLPLTLSRIGTNDTVVLFFALGTIYFFLRNRHWESAIFFGLAAGSKWSAIWIPPVLLALMIIYKKRPGRWVGWFIIIPPIIYLLSYSGFFMAGHTTENFIELQKQMYWYHTRLEATHPYSAEWWTWPLMLKPLWMYTPGENDTVGNIWSHGNPAVFWGGALAVIAAILIALASKRRELWALIIAYFGLFLPWSLSPRVMFIYHYLPSVPFLCLILAWILMSNKYWKKTAIIFLIITVLLFIFLYPRWAAIVIPDWWNAAYGWLP